jgi:hypothetical protein
MVDGEAKVFVFPEPFRSPELDEIFALVQSFDGYQEFPDTLAGLANHAATTWHETGELPDNVLLVKSCLFYEFRRARFIWGYPSERAMPYLRALASTIRTTR